MTWLDKLRKTQAEHNARYKDDYPIDLRRAALACLLDAAGVEDSASTGNDALCLLVVEDTDLFDQGYNFFRDVVGARGLDDLGGGFQVAVARTRETFRKEGLKIVGSHGTLHLVVKDVEWVDDDLLSVCPRVVHLTWSDAALRRLSAHVYGDKAKCAKLPGVEGLTLRDVVFARRASSTAREFHVALLSRLSGGASHARVKPVDASQVAPLSKMTGFGDAREWGLSLARDLRAYSQGKIEWGDVDKGMLLSGAPGTGKSTFARALAAEVGCNFVATGYADWHRSTAGGDSVSRSLKILFDEWRRLASRENPLIVFFDEIDSLGPRGQNAQNESWFAPMTNTWLAFLDGAVSREGIVVIGATNYPERVDPAMRRPGRLDRHVEIPLPDVDTLRGIVAYHGGWCTEDTLAAAKALRGRSPADVEQAVRDARKMARTLGRQACPDDVVDVVRAGRPQWSPAQLRYVAVHECGHAVVSLASGHFVRSIDVDQGMCTHSFAVDGRLEGLKGQIAATLGGRAAEEVVLGYVTGGAKLDLEQATALARKLHAEYGLGGSLVYESVDWPMTPRLLAAVERTLDECYATAVDIVRRRRHVVDALVEAAMSERYLDEREILDVVRKAERKKFDAFFTSPAHANDDARLLADEAYAEACLACA